VVTIPARGAMTNSAFLDRHLVMTGDGSHSLYLTACNEHYHSTHGALRESRHIFIACGYDERVANAGGRLRVLEVGFGTGLNALLTWERCGQGKSAVEYVAIEAFPVTVELASQLNYARRLASPAAQQVFSAMHQCVWGKLYAFRGILLAPQTADQNRGFRAG
jgi:tRNA U34 5-methylaminomethyl-2-thiouridine-forming methyltransferase MnmC